MSQDIGPSDAFKEFVNPSRQFKSIEECGNFFKQERTDDKFMEMLRKEDMPINDSSPEMIHNMVFLVLFLIRPQTPYKRMLLQLMKIKTFVATMIQRQSRIEHENKKICMRAGTPYFPQFKPVGPNEVTTYLAKELGVHPDEVRRKEVEAMDYIKEEISKRDLGTWNDLINAFANFKSKDEINREKELDK